MREENDFPPGFEDMLRFPMVEALFGRRSRRFSLGASIPEGPFAFTSRHEPLPLTELEKMLVLTATGGNTGWHFMHMRNARYAPHLPNYSAGAGGRTFPSGAGIHTVEIFFTDDDGVYFFATRDAPALLERGPGGAVDLNALLEAHRGRISKLADGRLHIPATEPYVDGHNTWCANRPGTLLVVPVADVAQYFIGFICFLVQNGYTIYDDINRERIGGLDRFRHMVDVDSPLPLSVLEQQAITGCTEEVSTSCYAGMLMLQAMGLGGWLYDGIDRFTLLGASDNPDIPGLGFRYDIDERWPTPNLTGLPGVFEAFCPPHFSDMRAAVEAFVQRKFGRGGPYHVETPGPWKDSAAVRGSAQIHDEEFKDCVTLQAQHIFDRFGKFPGTVPSVYTRAYLQAHHLDLEFYDHHFSAGAYLHSHAEHMARWHGEAAK